MPLHLEYRPKSLKEIVGNKSTVASIESILKRKTDRPRAWLFTGPSGCGKTTLARIVAAKLGIDDRDLQELNIASTRGIDNAREIQMQMRLRPMGGEARGWILDEIHMATKEFQNAMLKTLEDTPPHVFFFLCTTDPQKLLKTIATRCTTFTVEALSTKQIMDMLVDVVEAEKIDMPNKVLAQICEDSNGSARAALVTLDAIIDMEPDEMLEAAAKKMSEQNEAIDLCRALIRAEKWKKVAEILGKLNGADVENVRQAVMGYCNAILLKEDSVRAWLVLDAFKEPFDRSGRPGLTWAAYMATQAK